MIVRMRTKSAGPDGILLPGKTYDLPEEQAQALMSGGYAEPLDAPEQDISEPVVADIPSDEPLSDEQEEDIALPRRRRRS